MAKKDENGFWLDENGNPVPPKHIHPDVKKRDRVTSRVAREVLSLSQRMSKVKQLVQKLVKDYLDSRSEKVNLDEWKGNASLVNFDKTIKVDLSVADVIRFDENLQLAKQIIDECLQKWAKDSNDKLRLIVTHAFKVDRKGRINVRQVLDLRTHKINDARWNEAMDLISEAITVDATREYIKVYVRDNHKDPWKMIPLNWSSM